MMLKLDLRGYFFSRLPAAAIFMVILIALLAVGAYTPMSRVEAQAVVSQFNEMLPRLITNPVGIFLNNFLASLLMMIPAVGMALAAFIVYNTGLVIGAYSIVHDMPVALSLVIPFFTVYGFIEMLAYGFAVSQSFFLISSVFKKRFKNELHLVPPSVIAVVSLLLLGALVEWTLIVFLQGFLPS